MGDAGEGLVDSQSRVQERLDELARAREEKRAADQQSPEAIARRQELESLRLARAELQRQLETTTHERRRAQITAALTEIDRRVASLA